MATKAWAGEGGGGGGVGGEVFVWMNLSSQEEHGMFGKLRAPCWLETQPSKLERWPTLKQIHGIFYLCIHQVRSEHRADVK